MLYVTQKSKEHSKVKSVTLHAYHIISYHIISFISFRRSVQVYKIHMYMEIVTFLEIKK